MNKNEIRASVDKILATTSVGSMATVKNNQPHSRYMTFFNQDLTLFTATNAKTEKIEEIEDNPNTHILIGYEGDGFGDDYVEYTGSVSINDSPELKNKFWNEYTEKIFEGPDDPNYIILEIKPAHIQLMNKNGMNPHELEF